MKKMVFLFILFVSFEMYSKNIEFRIDGLRDKKYSFMDVCKVMGFKNVLLVDVINTTHIDCMGKSLKITNFCKDIKYKDLSYMRGFVDTQKKKVICQFGRRGYLSLICNKLNNNNYCKKSYDGCKKLNKIFANKLELFHHGTLVGNSNQKELKCIFSAKSDEDEVKI